MVPMSSLELVTQDTYYTVPSNHKGIFPSSFTQPALQQTQLIRTFNPTNTSHTPKHITSMGPLAPSMKPFQKIAIFGAGGTNIGHHVLEALVKDPGFTVTVLVRESSKSTFASNIAVTRIADDFPYAALVEALQGHDVLISAVGPEAKDAEYKLVEAAIEAGVRRFFPTEYGLDNSDPKNAAVSPIFAIKYDMQQHLKSKQKEGLTWTSVGTGMWIDW
jgi:hypothetical protein